MAGPSHAALAGWSQPIRSLFFRWILFGGARPFPARDVGLGAVQIYSLSKGSNVKSRAVYIGSFCSGPRCKPAPRHRKRFVQRRMKLAGVSESGLGSRRVSGRVWQTDDSASLAAIPMILRVDSPVRPVVVKRVDKFGKCPGQQSCFFERIAKTIYIGWWSFYVRVHGRETF